MITITRLDDSKMIINCDHILSIERTPDTVLMLTNGVPVLVKETIEDVIERIVAYRRRCAVQGPTVGPVIDTQGAR